jgi:hypothetical protein
VSAFSLQLTLGVETLTGVDFDSGNLTRVLLEVGTLMELVCEGVNLTGVLSEIGILTGVVSRELILSDGAFIGAVSKMAICTKVI